MPEQHKYSYHPRRSVTTYWLVPLLMLLIVLASAERKTTGGNGPSLQADTSQWPAHFGFGRSAGAADISRWDIAVRPDGKGLPAGSATIAGGRLVYQVKCAACHGTEATPLTTKLPAGALVSKELLGLPFTRLHTIGNYWPYSTTLFDYIRRAMPYTAPGSLNNNEVYAVTGYLLQANGVVDSNFVANAGSLPKVVMPAQKLFIPDDRQPGPEIR